MEVGPHVAGALDERGGGAVVLQHLQRSAVGREKEELRVQRVVQKAVGVARSWKRRRKPPPAPRF